MSEIIYKKSRGEIEKIAQREAEMRKKAEMKEKAEELALRERQLKEKIRKLALRQKRLTKARQEVAEEKTKEIEERLTNLDKRNWK